MTAKKELEEAQDRTIVSLAAMNGLLLVILFVMTVAVVWLAWQNRRLRKEVEVIVAKQIQDSKKKEKDQDETDSGASSSGINRPAGGGISHMPTATKCEECVIPRKRTSDRRPVDENADPTVSADDEYPRVTTCQRCGEIVNVWTVSDNRNGNRGRKYTKCSNLHFVWLDYVEWHDGVKRTLKKRDS